MINRFLLKVCISLCLLMVLHEPIFSAEKGEKSAETKKGKKGAGKNRPFQDNNKDGKITKEDFSENTLKLFEEYDLNGDGQIDPSEKDTFMLEAKEKKAEQFEKRYNELIKDKNGDGKIKKDDFEGKDQKIFAKVDLNKDGKIDEKEKSDFIASAKEKMLNGKASKTPKKKKKKPKNKNETE